MAMSPARRVGRKLDAASLRRRLAEKEGRAGRCIDLVAVMHLHNLDVELGTERRRRLLHEAGEQVDAKAHIAGLHDDRVARGRADLPHIVFAQARGADHMDEPRLRGERGESKRAGGRREVEHAVRLGESSQASQVSGMSKGSAAGERARILAEMRMALALDGTREHAILGFADRADERRAHPSPRADHHEAHIRHVTHSFVDPSSPHNGGATEWKGAVRVM